MLTPKDIQKIVEAHKEVFYSKVEMDNKFEGLRDDYSKLQTAVLSFAKDTKNTEEDVLVMNESIRNHEEWINRAGPKIGLEFKP